MNTTSLSLHLQGYVALQEALGYLMWPRARILRQFIVYLESGGVEGPVTAQMAVDWACAASDRCGTSGRAARLTAARGFLEYLSALVPGTEVPSAKLLVRPARRRPFLFTTTEVASLLDAALCLGSPGSLRPHTTATFLGLLATTGLRVSEAMKLRVSDVRLRANPPHLVIRQTKFRKTRLVLLHATTTEKLRSYAQQRH